jgi:hypothetical protein
LLQEINFISQGIAKIRSTIDDPHQVMSVYGLSVTDMINLSGGIPSNCCRILDVPPSNLNDLLKTEDGKSFWLAYGFSWSAEFHLQDTSKSIAYLKQYLKETGKDFEI